LIFSRSLDQTIDNLGATSGVVYVDFFKRAVAHHIFDSAADTASVLCVVFEGLLDLKQSGFAAKLGSDPALDFNAQFVVVHGSLGSSVVETLLEKLARLRYKF